MKLREAEIGDGAAILDLCQGIIDAEGIEAEIELTPTDVEKYLAMNMKDRPFRCLIADDDGVKGIALWQQLFSFEVGPVLYVESLAVDQNTRNTGVGSTLMDELKAICQREKYSSIYLNVHKNNLSARSFYLKQGGEIDDGWDFVEITVR